MAQTTATRQLLSGSTSGRPIKIAATATAGTLLHTATNTGGEFDEVYIWIVNTDTTARKVTIELGGVTSPDDLIEETIQPEEGLALVVPGATLNGGVVVRAFAASADVLLAVGYVNRIVNGS